MTRLIHETVMKTAITAPMVWVVVVVCGCGVPPVSPEIDGGPLDGGAFDAGTVDDAGLDDGGVDEGTPDAGRDASSVDAGDRFVRLHGGVQKGPFIIGSSVAISPVDSMGNPIGTLFNTMTENNLGDFNVDFSYLGPVSLEATGYFYNESAGVLSRAPLTLRAYHEVTSGGEQAAYVNLVTHLTYGRVRHLIFGGSAIAAATEQAERELRSELGIGPPGFTPEAPGIYLNLFGGDNDSNAYLFVVSAALTGAAVVRGGSTGSYDSGLQELLAIISTDLASDGILGDAVKTEVSAAYRALAEEVLWGTRLVTRGEEIVRMLYRRLESLGSAAVVPEIQRMFDGDADGVFGGTDNCRDIPNPGQENGDGDAWGDACDNDTLWTTAGWEIYYSDGEPTRMVSAWGDVDGDGDLDLAAASESTLFPAGLFRNGAGRLRDTTVWRPTDAPVADPAVPAVGGAAAWGDVDGDGDLDLAVGDHLFRNDAGRLTSVDIWNAAHAFYGATSLAWGDVDNDGDPDLAMASRYDGLEVYRNEGGSMESVPVWGFPGGSGGLAWGDVDGDGDLDLAAGYGRALVFLNEGGALGTMPAWSSTELDSSTVAWGDVDDDGDVDLATETHLYRNDGGVLTPTAIWNVFDASRNMGVAWGDVDEDGDLDLAAGLALYRNESGTLATTAMWRPTDGGGSVGGWGDVDGDGDLDLAAGSKVYLNTLR